ncbi:hypothetical protein HOLleu_10221 [Holothuria leucospilota]|uniref:Uncharacterized protein n=1 Tax=Holothuria leucospilota TaxID=206669 RepID=A0A9Q1CD97_HOLLE|nr:hypothetical protein HOLleu_10221 [Holothuria leucospilota]
MTGLDNKCLALDEAHDMGINKEVKMAMNGTDPEGLNRLVHYLPYRSRINCNMIRQLKNQHPHTDYDAAHHTSVETNIRCYIEKLSESHAFEVSDCAFLRHLFDEKVASPLVTDDLTTFYSTGEEDFLSYVRCFILGDRSTKAVRKTRNLHTFGEKKRTQVKKQQELKDHKLQIACLRKQVAWSKSNNSAVSSLSQFIPLPRAICDFDGIPNKGAKAVAATFLQKRYPEAFLEKPDRINQGNSTCVIMEGMFMINLTRPLDCHKTFGDYAFFLYKQWVVYAMRFLKASEIHIVFDHPGRHGALPKDIERQRRDCVAGRKSC